MKLAVLFPGIGYTCDKPLIYYSAKLAASLGYQVMPIPYGHFPPKVRGDAEKLRQCFELAWAQAVEMLSGVDLGGFGELLFIGKSIGTTVACRYLRENGLQARSVLLTPLQETFQYVNGPAVAFHGTADPWAQTDAIRSACRALDIPLHIIDGANHSLETGDLERDLRTLCQVMDTVSQWLRAPARG